MKPVLMDGLLFRWSSPISGVEMANWMLHFNKTILQEQGSSCINGLKDGPGWESVSMEL